MAVTGSGSVPMCSVIETSWIVAEERLSVTTLLSVVSDYIAESRQLAAERPKVLAGQDCHGIHGHGMA